MHIDPHAFEGQAFLSDHGPTLARDGFEVLVGEGLTQVLTDQSPAGRAVMMGLLDALCAGAKPRLTEEARARMERSNAVFLYGEASVLACEAEGYATPIAKHYGQRMTPAERQASEDIDTVLAGKKLEGV